MEHSYTSKLLEEEIAPAALPSNTQEPIGEEGVTKTQDHTRIKGYKPPYMNIKYHEDRIQEEEKELLLSEIESSSAYLAAKYNNFHPVSSYHLFPSQSVVGVAPSLHKPTIGSGTILPRAMKVHPRGFKMLSPGSPIDRTMKGYFRHPPNPPKYIQEEHAKLRDAITTDIIKAEKCKQRVMEKMDAQDSQLGTAPVPLVTKTLTTTVRRSNGEVMKFHEIIYGYTLDGFLLLENSTNEFGDKNSKSKMYTSVSEKYLRMREKEKKRERTKRLVSDNHNDSEEEELSNTFITGTGLEGEERNSDVEEYMSEEDDEKHFLKRHDGHATVLKDPSESLSCKLTCMNLINSVEVDLSLFTNLKYIDVGENRLLLSDLRSLCSIEEIHIHCNCLTQLSDLQENEVEVGTDDESKYPNSIGKSVLENKGYFMYTHTLNLSFNRIPTNELKYLSALPALTRLDISHNSLQTLTMDFSEAIPNVTHLCMVGNRFRNALHVFSCLSTVPQLLEVNLSDNLFEAIPSFSEIMSYISQMEGETSNSNSINNNSNSVNNNSNSVNNNSNSVNNNSNSVKSEELGDKSKSTSGVSLFPSLAVLGMANNKLQFFEDVYSVVQIPNLIVIALWGNELNKRAKDKSLVINELNSLGIQCILDPPRLPKKTTQDFYSILPPEMDTNKKRSRKRTLTQHSVLGMDPETTDTVRQMQQDMYNIFGTSAGTEEVTCESQTKLKSSRQLRFVRLPEEIHYNRIRGLKALSTTASLAHAPLSGPNTYAISSATTSTGRKRELLAMESDFLLNIFPRPINNLTVGDYDDIDNSVIKIRKNPPSKYFNKNNYTIREIGVNGYSAPTYAAYGRQRSKVVPTNTMRLYRPKEIIIDDMCPRGAVAELRKMVRRKLPSIDQCISK